MQLTGRHVWAPGGLRLGSGGETSLQRFAGRGGNDPSPGRPARASGCRTAKERRLLR
jgi:hypothetical protein